MPPNHLAGETSPYLRQHAENPVDWYPWGEAALARAKGEDKPILLSIGYAACHWCHVMAHESFEDPATAAVMNEHFVNVKVDREERPDLDAIYMQAVQAMTGHGGWPMTVFLTPAGEPFYGGTYFPPTERHGIPAFTEVLRAVAEAYRSRRDSILKSAAAVREIYRVAGDTAPQNVPQGDASTTDALPRTLELAYRGVAQQYDGRHGGLGAAPKFPPTMALDFLLRHWARTGTRESRDMALQTFQQMARGGIYDQVGGGFARYAVDAAWLVPHFEKMLYDNALLIRFGAHLYQATHDEGVRRVTEETVQWLAREMTAPDGGFYSSLDADSEGEEGKFYLWTVDELDTLLGADTAVVKAYFGVSAAGNFEGKNILHVPEDERVVAARAGVGVHAVRNAVQRARTLLYEARARRVRPARDEKILAAWNGLALRGVVEAARTFGRDDFTQLARRNAEFLDATLVRDVDGTRVMRVYAAGTTHVPGFLEDHAAVALGFLAMFEHTLEPHWLARAHALAESVLTLFWDDALGMFYDTARDAETLITRPRDVTDNAIPSGTSLAAELLLRLASYLDNESYRGYAHRAIASLTDGMTKYPAAFGHLLGAAEYATTFACHGDYCDMPSPRALEVAMEVAMEIARTTRAPA